MTRKRKTQPALVSQLASLLQSLAVSGVAPAKPKASRNRRKRRSKRTTPPGVVISSPMTDGSQMIMSGVETVEIPQAAAGTFKKIEFGPSNSGLRISKFADLYEKFLVQSASVEFCPALGSSEGGTVVVGIDFDASMTRSSFASVASLSPRWVGSVSSSGRFTISPAQLARSGEKFSRLSADSKRDKSDCYPFTIHVYVPNDKAIGYVTVRYKILFSGQGGS